MSRKAKTPEVVLSGVLIQSGTGRYTAYFEEFPDIVAEGDNEEEAKDNLIEAFIMVAQFKVQQRAKKRAGTELSNSDRAEKAPVKHFHQPFGQLQAQ